MVLSESELELGHTKSSSKLGTPHDSSMGRIRVMALVKLKIQIGPGVLSAEEECEVPRQRPRPPVPYKVNRVLIVVVYPLSTIGKW